MRIFHHYYLCSIFVRSFVVSFFSVERTYFPRGKYLYIVRNHSFQIYKMNKFRCKFKLTSCSKYCTYLCYTIP